MNKSQLHVGHRERMLKRFADYPDSLNDHELLEIVLYNLVPRKDTNPLAHRLIRVFGSLKNVFTATVKELMCVEGIGKKMALNILAIGEVYSRAFCKKREEPKEKWLTPEAIVQNLRKMISGYQTEKMVMVLLDKDYHKVLALDFEDENKSSVTMDIPELISAIIVHKPKYVIVAHNHPSGLARPSLQDDFTTKKLTIFCQIHGVHFMDHVILTDRDTYSYFRSDRLQYILNEFDLRANSEKFGK